MEKFSSAVRGYDKDEVNKFLEDVIVNVEAMLKDIKKKDIEIAKLKSLEKTNNDLNTELERYKNMEQTMNRAIYMAQKTSEQMRQNSQIERDSMLNDAKRNASRIVNEALLKAENAELEAARLNRNIMIFKRRVKSIIETQLEVVDTIETLDLESGR